MTQGKTVSLTCNPYSSVNFIFLREFFCLFTCQSTSSIEARSKKLCRVAWSCAKCDLLLNYRKLSYFGVVTSIHVTLAAHERLLPYQNMFKRWLAVIQVKLTISSRCNLLFLFCTIWPTIQPQESTTWYKTIRRFVRIPRRLEGTRIYPLSGSVSPWEDFCELGSCFASNLISL